MPRLPRAVLVTGCLAFFAGVPLPAQVVAQTNLLARHYQDGELLHYHMSATNQGRVALFRYEADAIGRVTRDSTGRQFEAFEWSHLVQNDSAVPLPAGGASVRQLLTLSPEYILPPDMAHADGRLVGPVLDLFTFYVDLWLAARSPALAHPGDEVRIPGRGTNSWADGSSVIRGEDAVDFVITLVSIDSAARLARVLVRHLPPEPARVPVPVDWMRAPVADAPNNWVQIESDRGRFVAGVGRETFDVWLTVSLRDGKIETATMDNPVEVLERSCSDRALTSCDAPVRYQIRRKISLTLVPSM